MGQETYVPAKGGEIRARQIATLSEIAHVQFTGETFGNILQELLSKDGLSAVKKNVQLRRKLFILIWKNRITAFLIDIMMDLVIPGRLTIPAIFTGQTDCPYLFVLVTREWRLIE